MINLTHKIRDRVWGQDWGQNWGQVKNQTSDLVAGLIKDHMQKVDDAFVEEVWLPLKRYMLDKTR